MVLVSFALLAPAALPAGGGDHRSPQLRRREAGRRAEPLLAHASCELRCAPEHHAPVLARCDTGTPFRVLRRWCSPRGERWLQVEWAAPPEGLKAAAAPAATAFGDRRRRGWLPG